MGNERGVEAGLRRSPGGHIAQEGIVLEDPAPGEVGLGRRQTGQSQVAVKDFVRLDNGLRPGPALISDRPDEVVVSREPASFAA